MKFRYIACTNPNTLIQNFYELDVEQKDLPLLSSVVSTAQCHIIHLESKSPVEIIFKNDIFKNNGTVLLGQSYKAYKLKANIPYYSFGINFHPTALYKLTGTNMSLLTDKHIPLFEVNKDLHNILAPLFGKKKSANILAKRIEKEMLQLTQIEDENTKIVDEAIQLIYDKEGITYVDELLEVLPISQKHLQTQFKKIVGLTPIKFIKVYKFLCMIKRFEREAMPVSKLIEEYNYYDLSHFTKDFKIFMNQKPSDYFKTDHEFLNNYLKS